MMGQQQTVAGSTLLRRMVLALAIVAVMGLLVMASAAPAFAGRDKAEGPSVEQANQVAKQTTGNNLNEIYAPGKGGTEVTSVAANPNEDPLETPGISDIASNSH